MVSFAPGGGTEAVQRRKELSTQAAKEFAVRPPSSKAFLTAGATFSDLGSTSGAGGAGEQYEAFVAAHAKSLRAYAALRDEQRALRHLMKHTMLLEGVAHVRLWFFRRHVDLSAKGKVAAVEDEAAGFFLLDAAADAARTVLARGGGGGSVDAAAAEGVNMLAQALGARGDPVGLRPRIAERVQAWAALVDRNATQRHATARKQQLKARQPVTDPARLLPGLGYDVLGPIAAGAFSTILRCREVASGLEVAVKSFDAAKCAKDAAVGAARERELGVLRILAHAAERAGDGSAGHPHIASLLGEIGDVEAPHVHAILEYCGGGSLKRHLQTLQKATPLGEGMKATAKAGSPGMAPPLAARGAGQVASALAHLHRLGIAHGDVKPANILLAAPLADHLPLHGGGLASLRLKLCDFGFACVCGDKKLKTFCGTPAYLAPEAVSEAEAHKGFLGRPVDMWALGCVVYEMLHGKPAFAAPEAYQLQARVRACRHHPIDESLPAPARQLVTALLTIPPQKRLVAERVLERPWVRDALAADESSAATLAPSAAAVHALSGSSPPRPHAAASSPNPTGADGASDGSSVSGAPAAADAIDEGAGLLAGMFRLLSA